MNLDVNLMQVAEVIVGLGGAILTIQKIGKNLQRSKEAYADEILKEAKEEIALLKAKLESRIEATRSELKSLEFNISKDISHIKEAYTSEIKNLGEKIELIREQLNAQHTQLLEFLTKLIEKQ